MLNDVCTYYGATAQDWYITGLIKEFTSSTYHRLFAMDQSPTLGSVFTDSGPTDYSNSLISVVRSSASTLQSYKNNVAIGNIDNAKDGNGVCTNEITILGKTYNNGLGADPSTGGYNLGLWYIGSSMSSTDLLNFKGAIDQFILSIA